MPIVVRLKGWQENRQPVSFRVLYRHDWLLNDVFGLHKDLGKPLMDLSKLHGQFLGQSTDRLPDFEVPTNNRGLLLRCEFYSSFRHGTGFGPC